VADYLKKHELFETEKFDRSGFI